MCPTHFIAARVILAVPTSILTLNPQPTSIKPNIITFLLGVVWAFHPYDHSVEKQIFSAWMWSYHLFAQHPEGTVRQRGAIFSHSFIIT